MAGQRESFGNTTKIGELLDRIKAAEPGAREELLAESQERFRQLASRMLKQFPQLRVRGRAETGIVLNDVLLEMHAALDRVAFESPRHFINLAAQKTRQTLLDLARKYKHHPFEQAEAVDENDKLVADLSDRKTISLEEWAAFHEAAGRLPEKEKEVFDLLYYGQWKPRDAARILGVVEKTVERRFKRAKKYLAEALRDETPD
jgi:RNA polymerase sigma factor (sigma-70 family)